MSDNMPASQRPLFSVIVPVYNAEDYLEECLSSVLVQSFSDWEAIVIDDGSTDGSARICERIARTYPSCKFKIIKQENSGQGRARRAGINAAQGELCIFLDSDDFLMDDEALQKMADAYSASHFDVCLYNAYWEKWGHPCVDFIWPTGLVDLQSARETLYSVRTPEGYCDLGYIFKVVRTDILKQVEDANIPLMEDRIMTFGVFDRAKTVFLIDECLYFYRDTPGSKTSQDITEERLDCHLKAIKVADRHADKWHVSEVCRKFAGIGRKGLLYDYILRACNTSNPIGQLALLRGHAAYDALNADDPYLGKDRRMVFSRFDAGDFRATYLLMKCMPVIYPLNLAGRYVKGRLRALLG